MLYKKIKNNTSKNYFNVNNKVYHDLYYSLKHKGLWYMIPVLTKHWRSTQLPLMFRDIERELEYIENESFIYFDYCIEVVQSLSDYAPVDFEYKKKGDLLSEEELVKIQNTDENVYEFLNLSYSETKDLKIKDRTYQLFVNNNKSRKILKRIGDCLNRNSLQFGESSSYTLRVFTNFENYDVSEATDYTLDRTIFSCGVSQFEGLNDISSVDEYKYIFEVVFHAIQVQTLICSTTSDEISTLLEFLNNCGGDYSYTSMESYNNNSGYDITTFIIKSNIVEYIEPYEDDYYDEDEDEDEDEY